MQRELERLAAAGLLTVSDVGNQKHYQANRASPIFNELRGIVLKTFGIADVLREALAEFGSQVSVAFIYGSVARGLDTAKSDIDVMILGDRFAYGDALRVLSTSAARIGRKVNPTLYGLDEWRRKLRDGNSFVRRVMEQPKIFLVGSADDLPKPRKSGKGR